MIRVTNAVVSRNRRKKVLKSASGYWGRSSSCFRLAKRVNDRGMSYQYRDRRNKKRVMRRAFIERINAWARLNGMNYSEMIHKLPKDGVNRKIIADLAFSGKDEILKSMIAT